MAPQFVLAALPAPFFVAALLAIIPLPGRWRITGAQALVTLGGFSGAWLTGAALVTGEAVRWPGYQLAPFLPISFGADSLSWFFAFVICVVVAFAGLYAIGYFPADHDRHGAATAAFSLFAGSMLLVVFARSLPAFVMSWEVMAVTSFLLVVHDHTAREVRSAGFVYLAMTHIGTAFLLVAFLIFFGLSGSLDFQEIAAAASAAPDWLRDVLFVLLLVGFGAKAGAVPVHIWLPRAHPAAPSHASAVMSGVMVKTAMYGLLRFGWLVLGSGQLWWGGLLLVIGAVSAVLGVLYALMEHDLKRLLAYSTVENVGIIFIGIGSGFVGLALNQPLIAALGMTAGLLHILNHAIFKTLLFLGAGAVQHAAGTRNVEKLGGLIRLMPWTAASVLAGSMAISGLPPLNGFVSEWLTYQTLLEIGRADGGSALAICAAVIIALLALTGGLAVACFVKAFGIVFLAQPRSAHVSQAKEVGGAMRTAQLGLAVACIGLGIFPGLAFALVWPVVQQLAPGTPSFITTSFAMPFGQGLPLMPLGLVALLVGLSALPVALARLRGGSLRTRLAPIWACGNQATPRMQYNSTSLTKPLRLIFRVLLQPYRAVDERKHSLAPYFITAVHYEPGITPLYERYLYGPVVRGIVQGSRLVNRLQNGSIRLYLAYLFATLIVILILAR